MTQEGYYIFGIAESYLGFSMAIILDCLHMVGIIFSINHLLSIVRPKLGPKLFSCSTKSSCLTAASLFLITSTPLLYSSSLKGYGFEASPSVAGSTYA